MLYRYARAKDPARRQQLKCYVLGVSLLMLLYFVLYALEVYSTIIGHPLFQTNQAIIFYTLISEPLWFTLELVFAWSAGRSIFSHGMLEPAS